MTVLEHFDLNNHAAYARWRDWKLNVYPAEFSAICVDVKNPLKLSSAEQHQIQTFLNRYSMAMYRVTCDKEDAQIPLSMAQVFGLTSLDKNLGSNSKAVTHVQVKSSGVHGRYIPYTNKQLSWHCDGYYNSPSQKIRSFVLHCARAAQSGGENALFDPEIAYIHLRDTNPEYIRALFQNDAMAIPANIIDGKTIRAEQTGPIFSFDDKGNLHMRYSARKHNIRFNDDPFVTQALKALTALLGEPNNWVIRGKLGSGEGLICNNILHNRTAFTDDAKHPRLLYRLRYYERIPTNYI